MNKLKVLDLFSGIGGFSLGLERTGGFKTVAFCEIDTHCQKVLAKNFSNVFIFEDVSKLSYADDIGRLSYEDSIFKYDLDTNIDVICGGFPCQDISVAGLKKGITNETRSGLWFQFKRIIQEVNPRWVIIENVRNLLNNGLTTVLQDLNEIGYDAEWEIISARSIGANHLRERIWIVAYPSSIRLEKPRTLRQPLSKEEGRYRKGTNSIDGHANSEFLSERNLESSNSNDFRFWPSFTTEKEKQEWWTEATASFRNWWKTESTICRVDDGLPRELDKGRSQRIKQLGNSIVPQIAELIGQRILFHEHKMYSDSSKSSL